MEDQIMLEREIRQEFERIIAEMEWGEVLSTLNDMLGDMLTPAQLAELQHNTTQPAESQVGGYDKHATWKSLTVEEKDKYYKQAQKEKDLHAQQHPEWTHKNNYGKKKKKKVGCQRNASTAEASEFRPEDKRLIMAPHTLAGAMNIPHLQTGVKEPGRSTVILQLPPPWIPVAAPLHLLYHPQMYKVPSSSWQNVFPATPNNVQ
ncbi:Transcription factor 7-like 1-A [Larimichthys crocea]|uniref:Uncharacterized protein n=1 Tax=Larimichthys crocea TaxID=215358 RepID=A0ACD3QRF2_LARCR|nr:Transcription factor 7-like 1-A [Larimichthys crocea]